MGYSPPGGRPPPSQTKEGNLNATRTFHLIGICGTGMGSLAGLLKACGFEVRGSDQAPGPPISTMLDSLGIPVAHGYRPGNLDPTPDMVVVGNVVGRSNPEVVALLDRGLPYMSMPQALGEFVLAGRHPVVVAGTHGKTTTSALLSHVLVSADLDPSCFVGGVLKGSGRSFRLGSGPHVVVEGDEYETSFFDKGPKFLHYRPRTAILTSIEYDHAEMYSSVEAIEDAFRKLVRLVPEDGALIACADDRRAAQVAREVAGSRRVLYGLARGDLKGEILGSGPEGTAFTAGGSHSARGFRIPFTGRHNVLNALAVLAACRILGMPDDAIARGLESFPGVHRRQEVVGAAGGVTVIDDFAHHPTAVRETIGAIRTRFPGGTLWALFEPRTNTSRRDVFQSDYALAFDGADRAIIAAVDHPEKAPAGRRFDVERLVGDLRRRKINAAHVPVVEEIVERVATEAAPGDVVLVMSNGAFGGIHRKLLAALDMKAASPEAPIRR